MGRIQCSLWQFLLNSCALCEWRNVFFQVTFTLQRFLTEVALDRQCLLVMCTLRLDTLSKVAGRFSHLDTFGTTTHLIVCGSSFPPLRVSSSFHIRAHVRYALPEGASLEFCQKGLQYYI